MILGFPKPRKNQPNTEARQAPIETLELGVAMERVPACASAGGNDCYCGATRFKPKSRAVWQLAIALALGSPSVLAADTEPSGATQETRVTAAKREQAVSDVPITIQVLDRDLLDANHVKNLRDVLKLIPGSSQGASYSSANVRTQLRGVAQEAGDLTIGYYIDDAPFHHPGQVFAPIVRMVDIERVEVLKGPQSTLYGAGAMGGVLRVIPKAPNLEALEGGIRAGYSTLANGGDGYSLDVTASVPLVPGKLGARVSVADERDGGYVSLQPHALNPTTFGYDPYGPAIEEFGSREVSDLRLQVLAVASDQLTLKLLGIVNDSTISPTGHLILEPRNPPTAADTLVDASVNEMAYNLISGSIRYDFKRATLTSVVTQIDYEELWSSSYVTYYSLFTDSMQATESFSNETRFVSRLKGPWQWLAGIFYSQADTRVEVHTPANLLLRFPETKGSASLESRQVSAFGEGSYEFIPQKLTGTVGLRYFQDDRVWRESLNFIPYPLPDIKDLLNSVIPRVNLAYMPDDDTLYFLNIAKGFRSGTANLRSRCITRLPQGEPFRDAGGNPYPDACPQSIDTDELWSFELGTKQTWMGEQLFIDATLYFQQWNDMQGAALPTGLVVSNIGDADGFGIDIGVAFAPEGIPEFDMVLAVNWNNLAFTSLHPLVGAAFAGRLDAGDAVPTVPPFSSTITLNFDRQLTANVAAGLSVSWSHSNRHTASPGSVVEAGNRDYVNGKVGVVLSDKLGIHFFATNLTDEAATIWGQSGPLYPLEIRMIETPRKVGIEFSYAF